MIGCSWNCAVCDRLSDHSTYVSKRSEGLRYKRQFGQTDLPNVILFQIIRGDSGHSRYKSSRTDRSTCMYMTVDQENECLDTPISSNYESIHMATKHADSV